MTRPPEVVTLYGAKLRESEKAVLFQYCLQDNTLEGYAAHSKSEWFPFSQIVSIHTTFNAGNGILDSMVITKWLATTKGII